MRDEEGTISHLICVEPSDWLTRFQVEEDTSGRIVGCDHSVRVVADKVHRRRYAIWSRMIEALSLHFLRKA